MVERESVIEAGVALAAVLVMLGTMLWIGSTYGTDGGLSEEGATMLVAAIVGFIALLLLIGVALAFVLNDPEEGAEDADADAAY